MVRVFGLTQKNGRFTTYKDPGLSNSVIIGGRYDGDDRSFHGDIAHFQMFDRAMKDQEKYVVLASVCQAYNIPMDDGHY